jgi:ankyrin repeat protein
MSSNRMKKKKKPNAEQLYAAIRRKDSGLLRQLISEGADPNTCVHDEYHGDTPILLHAASAKFFDGVKLLLDAGADPNRSMSGGKGAGGGQTALHSAVGEGDGLRVVDLLLKAGADPNAVEQGDRVPLYYAASGGHYEIVQRLIEAGATFKTWPEGCMPPLTGAVAFRDVPEHQGQVRVAELLIGLGAPVDGETAHGVTALMAAAASGSEKLVRRYLDLGADVNHRAKDGRTPLLCAAGFARDEVAEEEQQLALRIVKRLLEAGADPNARNADGKSAYDIASRFRSSPASEYLKQIAGPKV